MANWTGTARSNYVYFKPGTLDALKKLFDIKTETDPVGRRAIFPDTDNGSVPDLYDPDIEQIKLLEDLGMDLAKNDDGEVDDLTMLDVIHLCLEENEIFIWMEIGAEKSRYVTGLAQAYDRTGMIKQVDLIDIYAGLTCTRAEF